MDQVVHIREPQLRSLIYADTDSREYQQTAEHVESCPYCQQRLEELVASPAETDEAIQMLSGYETAAITKPASRVQRRTAPAKRRQAQRDRSLDFLEPPSHPEMLGRLGRYEIERVVGAGGMGVVFKALDTELNRPVAVKALAGHLAQNAAARQRFARESQAVAAVVHEHVVAIHNVESHGEATYLVMQYVAGESLQDRVDGSGPCDAKQIMRIAQQAASGLAAAHEQGLVHRDVKPANILLENGVERVLLTDFGLARTLADASLTQSGVVAGTPQYMSPEQANGETTDERSDLFSLGAVMYFMATGHPPFRAETPMAVLHRICRHRQRPVWESNPDIPDELSDVIDRLLEKKPGRRFKSAAELRDRLTALLGRTQLRRNSIRQQIRRVSERRGPAVICALAACFALLSCGAFAWQRFTAPANFESPSEQSSASTSPSQVSPPSFAEELEGVQRQLSALEGESPDFIWGGSPPTWAQQVHSIHKRLDQLQDASGSVESLRETLSGESK